MHFYDSLLLAIMILNTYEAFYWITRYSHFSRYSLNETNAIKLGLEMLITGTKEN